MNVYRVSEVNSHIRFMLEGDPTLSDLWLQGEVSNFTRATSGHLYFTLKDEKAQISCVMWRSHAARQEYLPQSGQAIVAHGHISVYEVQGRYQFYVDDIQPAGVGLLHLEYERRIKELEAEGLFAEELKRPLPPFPKRIGIVTSRVAAALRDVLHVLNRRYPLVEVILAPTMVQGNEAPSQIVQAIRALNEHADVDLIIVTRGGGSLEDLWAFNDMEVARAIAVSRVPVVSGVGHETDFTIADFVADVRAPTPSAAAEISVPDMRELQEGVRWQRDRLVQGMRSIVADWRVILREDSLLLQRYSPLAKVTHYRQRVDELWQTATLHMEHRLNMNRERLTGLRQQLDNLSPSRTLERGYAIVQRSDDGEVVRSICQARTGDRIDIRVHDGEFHANVDREPERISYV